jgi:hypothetical protein
VSIWFNTSKGIVGSNLFYLGNKDYSNTLIRQRCGLTNTLHVGEVGPVEIEVSYLDEIDQDIYDNVKALDIGTSTMSGTDDKLKSTQSRAPFTLPCTPETSTSLESSSSSLDLKSRVNPIYDFTVPVPTYCEGRKDLPLPNFTSPPLSSTPFSYTNQRNESFAFKPPSSFLFEGQL